MVVSGGLSTSEKLASLNPSVRREGERERAAQQPPSEFFGTSSAEFGQVSPTGVVEKTPSQISKQFSPRETPEQEPAVVPKIEELGIRPVGVAPTARELRTLPSTTVTPARFEPSGLPSQQLFEETERVKTREDLEQERIKKEKGKQFTIGLTTPGLFKRIDESEKAQKLKTKSLELLIKADVGLKKLTAGVEVPTKRPFTILDIPLIRPVTEPASEFIFGIERGVKRTIKEEPLRLIGAAGVGALATPFLGLKGATGLAARTVGLGLGTAFVVETGLEVALAPGTRAKGEVIGARGIEVAAFGAGGAAGRKISSVISSVIPKARASVGAKLEQHQLNLALEIEGGKLVTKGFFKRADIGDVTITGEALISAKGIKRTTTTPFGTLELEQFTPKLEPVKITFPARKEPLPQDFLFRGKVKETFEARELGLPEGIKSLAEPGTKVTRTFDIAGFGFPKSLEVVTTPFKLLRVSPKGKPGRTITTREFKLEFTPTELARTQAVVPVIKPVTPKRAPKIKKLAPPGIEILKPPKDFGSVILGKEGRIFAPKGARLGGVAEPFIETPTRLVNIETPRRLMVTPPSSKFKTPITFKGQAALKLLKEKPIIARKVKITPPKETKVPKGFKVVEKEIMDPGSGQILIQKVLVKQKLKTEQKLAAVQIPKSIAADIKQTLSGKQKLKTGVKTGLKQKQLFKELEQPISKVRVATRIRQGVKQIPALSLKQKPSLALKPIQAIKLDQPTTQKIKTILDLGAKQIPLLDLITPTLPRTPRITTPTTPRILIPKLPKLLGGRLPKARKLRRVKRLTRFQPSLVAIEQRITTKRTRKKLEKELLTGLEIREIPAL